MTTIIRVKYIVTEYLSNTNDTERVESKDKEMLVNINCSIKMILNYIRKVAHISSTREFDLCDEINCQLKNVSFYEPYTNGTDILQPDITYVIVTFERDENGKIINLTPFLTDETAKKYCEILSRIEKSS